MMRLSRARARWLVVATFAAAMAWVESACVYYLRVMVGRIDPYQPAPLPLGGVLGNVELVREAATLVMLIAVGALAGRTARARLGYAAVAFGVWDLLYYVFLRIMSGWPRALFDWDVLFLLPLPWWGPVLAPCCIAALMIVWGTRATQRAATGAFESSKGALASAAAGVALALYVFMADSLRAVHDGRDVTVVLPESFNWGLFAAALLLMAIPLSPWPQPRMRGPRGRTQPTPACR